MSFKLLSVIAMQLLQQARNLKVALEAFKALLYLMLDTHQKMVMDSITDSVAKAISTATKRIRDELDIATDQLIQAAADSTEAGEQLKGECQEVMCKLKEVMKDAVPASRMGNLERDDGQEELVEEATEETLMMYASRVKKGIPPTHSLVVARVETQKKKIRLIKATGMVGEGLLELTEKQLVEKANLVLGMMIEGEESRPAMAKFVGASKERGLRGMTTVEAANWLKEKINMTDFLANMGSTTDYKEQTFEVVIDWVWASFEVKLQDSWRVVEQENRLKFAAIRGVLWIKPIHL